MVIGRAANKGVKVAWICKCDCGKETTVLGSSLRIGDTKSCGCLRYDALGGIAKNEIGNRYGRLIVVEQAKNPKGGGAYWLCKCDCGTEVIVLGCNLRRGTTKSCGCFRKEKLHGLHSLPIGEAAFNRLVSQMRHGARKRGLIWSITKEQIKQLTSQPCFYCGAEPSQGKSLRSYCNGVYIFNGLDRVNNERDYEINNVVPCCKCCNYAKRTMTQEEFLAWISRVYVHSVGKEK